MWLRSNDRSARSARAGESTIALRAARRRDEAAKRVSVPTMTGAASVTSIRATFLRKFTAAQKAAMAAAIADLKLPEADVVGHQLEAGFVEKASRDYFYLHVDSDADAPATSRSDFVVKIAYRERPKGSVPPVIKRRAQDIAWAEALARKMLGKKPSLVFTETNLIVRSAQNLPSIPPLVVGNEIVQAVGVEYSPGKPGEKGLTRIGWRNEDDSTSVNVRFIAEYDGQAEIRAWLRAEREAMATLVEGAFGRV